MVYGLGKRLQAQRLSMNLSQKEVAAAIGVSPSIISNYESSERVPSIENLMSLAALYKCSVNYLLGIQQNNHVEIDTSSLNEKQIRILQSVINEFKRMN